MPYYIKFKPNAKKVTECIMHLATRGLWYNFTIMEVLYIADLRHLNKYGRPITFDNYTLKKHRPAGTAAHRISTLNNIDESRPFKITLLGTHGSGKGPHTHITEPRSSAEHSMLFSRSDIEILNKVAAWYKLHWKEWDGLIYADVACEKARKREIDRYYWAALHTGNTNQCLHWSSCPKQENPDVRYEDMLEESPAKEETIENLSIIANINWGH